MRREFACGYMDFAGVMEHPCPSDPRFPKFSDYEIEWSENPERPFEGWTCHANPKTEMARLVGSLQSFGRTKEEALDRVKERYRRHGGRD
jgi:hypothetical protein